MKKKILMAIFIAMSVLFTGCGSSTKDNANQTTSVTNDSESPKTIAEGLIGSEVSELIDKVGNPDSSEYVDSCSEAGAKDGILTFKDCTVYTLKNDSGEKITKVK